MANKEKQIEQGMGDAKVIIRDTIYSISNEEDRKYITETLCDAGYRKTSDVAREIFEEIEAIKCVGLLPSGWVKQFAELKKKYIGEDTNVLTNTEGGE